MWYSSAHMNIMLRAATYAGKDLRRDFCEVEQLQSSPQSAENFTKKTVERVRTFVCDQLKKSHPSYGLITDSAEENRKNPEIFWLVKVLDGFNNFSHAAPHFSISLALAQQDALVCGLLYNPITDEMYSAERGQGSFLNKQRLRLSSRGLNKKAILSLSCAPQNISYYTQALATQCQQGMELRMGGSLSLDMAYLAAGRIDGLMAQAGHSYEVAAGEIIIREAGGFITDSKGDSPRDTKQSTIIAGNQGAWENLFAVSKKL